MAFSTSVIWLILALIMGGIEMMTGSFYLLMVALGCAGAALVAWLDYAFAWQLFTAALLTVVGAMAVNRFRQRFSSEKDVVQHPDVDRVIQIEQVSADGTAQVRYRGAVWTALAKDGVLTPGRWRIVTLDGPRLIVEPASKV